MKLSDIEIQGIIKAYEDDAIGYQDEVSAKRIYLLDRYNQELIGDEQEGQSQTIASDVADTIESMLPAFMRIFTKSKNIGVFTADSPAYDEEAKQKTELANWRFMRDNDGALILHNMFKDALLQYTGVVKVYRDKQTRTSMERYKGLSEMEYQKLRQDDELEFEETEQSLGPQGIVHAVKAKRTTAKSRTQVDNIPPEEFVIDRASRCFIDPTFIGQRTPKTRSDLVAMGFDKDVVANLPIDASHTNLLNGQMQRDHDNGIEGNPSSHSPNDIILLGEYYCKIDSDGDGITELWQVFKAGEVILEKTQVDQHPYCVIVPIPIPHRAIGNCPAEQAADIQQKKTVLQRQMLDNIYFSNYNRNAVNERVDLDALNSPRAGGSVLVEGVGPIGDSILPLGVPSVVGDILQAIEYANTEKELRTGVTRYNQGIDTDTLNKTATGFVGIRDMSQMRVEMIARIFADTGIREIFRKIIKLEMMYQDEAIQIRVSGGPLEVDPTSWRQHLDCYVDVGIGSGERMEKISNLSGLLQEQKQLKQAGSPLVDDGKIYNTLSKLIDELGLKDVEMYYNDPTQPQELLMYQNEQLMAMVEQMQAQMQNPLAEQEKVRQQGSLIRDELKIEADMQKFMLQMQDKQREREQKQDEFNRELMRKLTELELNYQQNVPGSAV